MSGAAKKKKKKKLTAYSESRTFFSFLYFVCVYDSGQYISMMIKDVLANVMCRQLLLQSFAPIRKMWLVLGFTRVLDLIVNCDVPALSTIHRCAPPHSKWGQMYLCVFKSYDKVHIALPTSKWAIELMKHQLCQCLSILESLLWMPWCTQVWGVHIQDEGETSYIKNMLNLPFYTTEFTELYMLQYWQTA